MLKMDEVYYTYPNGPCVLKGLSLHVPTGKKCALIGHNGCGKTTLFLHANGLLRSDSGDIYWNGEKMDYRRQTLQKWRLGVPLLAFVWKTLFPHDMRIPRNVEEMKQWMRMVERTNLRISEK